MATEMLHSCMAVNSGHWALCPAAPAQAQFGFAVQVGTGVQIKPFCRVLTGHIDVALLTAVLAVVADAQGALFLIYPIYAAYLIRLASLLRAQQIAAIARQGQAEITTLPVSSQMQVFGAAAAQDDQAAQGGKAEGPARSGNHDRQGSARVGTADKTRLLLLHGLPAVRPARIAALSFVSNVDYLTV